jgi:hypothetical protein
MILRFLGLTGWPLLTAPLIALSKLDLFSNGPFAGLPWSREIAFRMGDPLADFLLAGGRLVRCVIYTDNRLRPATTFPRARSSSSCASLTYDRSGPSAGCCSPNVSMTTGIPAQRPPARHFRACWLWCATIVSIG